MDHIDLEHPVLDSEMSVSDSESGTTSAFPREVDFLGDEVVRLDDEDINHAFVKKIFLSGMGSLGEHTTVVAIHRNSHSSFSARARLQAFRIYSEAMVKKCGANTNMKYGWYGTSKDGVCGILRHGFGQCETPEGGGLYGSGIYLSPADSSIDSVVSSVIDENGLRHVLLCRVILGNTEEVCPGSKQFHPSSEEFDSGVDNQLAPKRYIVWSTHMNTHILVDYIISFRIPSCPKGFPEPVRRPSSAWMPFPKLISFLSRFLPPAAISLIKRYHSDHLKKKITREYLIQRVRQIAGDKLLIEAIRYSRAKQQPKAMVSTPCNHKGL
ncbi:putative inactive poly [ADP-ribose] polymerase SRO2 [Tasmannia lanceolata]|uniref:putative inactive poly [ADP-ribose] polymerase SRO2 n=1 Tax=Tasmannia lanceolata TaxID=3420 RepID=UPI0040630745